MKIIEERDCPHDRLFEATSSRCKECDLNRECHWVRRLHEFSNFDDKPAHTINASLRYGIKLVESLNPEPRHENECACEACCWIRDTRQLIASFEENLAPNPYRPSAH
jgi:hypothetical protein